MIDEAWQHEVAPGVPAGDALGALSPTGIAAAIVAALAGAAVPVDVMQINDTTVAGAGVPGDEWGP